jgi:hypothetical protein
MSLRTISNQPSPQEMVSVTFISSLSETAISLTIQKILPIRAMKMNFGWRIRIRHTAISLIFRDEELTDQRTIESYGITNGSTIRYVVQMNTSHASQPARVYHPAFDSVRRAPTVPLPNLPSNGTVANRQEIRINVAELRARGCAGLVIIPDRNGGKRVVMLNSRELEYIKMVNANRVSRGLPSVNTAQPHVANHAIEAALGIGSFPVSDGTSMPASASTSADSLEHQSTSLENASAPAFDSSPSAQALVSGDSKMTDLLAKIRAAKQAHADRMAKMSK